MRQKEESRLPNLFTVSDSEKGIKYINDIYISTVLPYLRRVEEILRNR